LNLAAGGVRELNCGAPCCHRHGGAASKPAREEDHSFIGPLPISSRKDSASNPKRLNAE